MRITHIKKKGAKNNTNTVVAVMPPSTPIDIAFCAPDPGPDANAKGITPKINVIDVIKIGRSLCFAAITAESYAFMPSSKLVFANSIIKIAFFAAKALSLISPPESKHHWPALPTMWLTQRQIYQVVQLG
jgi:hypothetical protein